jgi:hypothetical protein
MKDVSYDGNRQQSFVTLLLKLNGQKKYGCVRPNNIRSSNLQACHLKEFAGVDFRNAVGRIQWGCHGCLGTPSKNTNPLLATKICTNYA